MLPLVLIPALFCDHRLYEPVAAGLADRVAAQVVVPNGRRLGACARDVLARVPGRFVVAGTSFGGHVALATALAAPKRVAGLWIMGAAAGAAADPRAGRERARRVAAEGAGGMVADFAATIVHGGGEHAAAARDAFLAMGRDCDPQVAAAHLEALAARPDRWQRLAGIACPSLLLWGEDDSFSAAADGLRMSAVMADARYAGIPECGHLPTLEAPDEVVAIARHWLVDAGLAR